MDVDGGGVLDSMVDAAFGQNAATGNQGAPSEDGSASAGQPAGNQQVVDPISMNATESAWAAAGLPDPEAQAVIGTANAAGNDQQGAPQNDGVPDVDNPDSFKYYQSRYDKATNELTQAQKDLEDHRNLLRQLVRERESQMQVNPNQGVVGAPNQASAQPLQPPTMPEKPADFDDVEASTDPNSSSAKYLRDLQAYRDARLDYVENLMLQQAQQAQLRQREIVAETQRQAMHDQLRNTYGMSSEDITEFETLMDDPTILTVPNLVKFFSVLKGKDFTVNRPAAPAPPPRMPLPPRPASTAPASPRQPQRAAEDVLIDDMIRMAKEDNIFG